MRVVPRRRREAGAVMQHVVEVGGPGELQGAHATVDGSRCDDHLPIDLAFPMRPHNI